MAGRCEVYGDLSKNFRDLKEDNNLVKFFKAVLERRDWLKGEENCVSDTLGASSVPGLPGIRTRRPGDRILSADYLCNINKAK